MPDPTSCCRVHGGYCQRCDVLVGLVGLHVIGVDRSEGGLRVQVESGRPVLVGCPSCGVVAHAHGRQTVELIDAPCFTSPVRLWWRKRRFRCPEPSCPVTSFNGAGPAGGAAEGVVDAAGDPVGDRADAPRERVGAGSGAAAGLLLEDVVEGGPARPELGRVGEEHRRPFGRSNVAHVRWLHACLRRRRTMRW